MGNYLRLKNRFFVIKSQEELFYDKITDGENRLFMKVEEVKKYE